jgi:cell division protein FtsI (penicillin-binding protein 3)
MSPIDLPGLGRPPSPRHAWRRVIESVWWVEHAFERSKAAGRATDDTRLRIFFVLVIFAMGFVTLGVEATRSALFSPAASLGAAIQVPAGARADLVDRNGELMALDLTHYGVYLDARQVWDRAETRRNLLAVLPKLTAARLDKALASSRREYLLGGLTPQEQQAVHDLGMPGVAFEEEQRRVYPLGQTASHLIGFSDTGGRGLAGIERGMDKAIQAGAGGAPLPLSIDLRIQGVLEDELRKAVDEFHPQGGAVGVVTNVRSGEVLGLTSWPDFNPNDPGASTDNAKLNRAANSVYEMGSTFKAFTVAVGLDTGVANINSTFDAREPFKLGYRTVTDYHATRKILSLVEVFQHSSNVGTAKLAVEIGPERLSRYFGTLGLTKPAQIELAETASPIVPRKWDEDAMVSTSFGHGMNVSPLALAEAYGAVMNGGLRVPLTLKKRPPGYKPDGPRAVSEATSAQMLQIMRANVTGGSGKNADIPGLTVGGKTGTGDKFDFALRAYSHTKQVSSFAAVFPTAGPADTPRYLVLILVDEPQHSEKHPGDPTGGVAAAPAAGRVIDRIAPFLGVQRQAEIQPAEKTEIVGGGL